MLNIINGALLKGMLLSAGRNLRLHRAEINELNVFPVPDGDTGTNMVLTFESGISALRASDTDELPVFAPAFCSSVALSARGNSGVILSQFLCGWLDGLASGNEVRLPQFAQAMSAGVKKAYDSVAEPVEGTMLTVLREGTEAAALAVSEQASFESYLHAFLTEAAKSLENTPNLLPVLKEANVVDSGGAGVVCLFEGMLAALEGNEIGEETDGGEEHGETAAPALIDYSAYGRNSIFVYGYCTELLIQLLDGFEVYDPDSFRSRLGELGSSIVLSESDHDGRPDKVKVHIHTPHPEQVLTFCHRFGEFLNLKIENMTVQHTELAGSEHDGGSPRPVKACGPFAVVAVASDEMMEELMLEMGADVVLRCAGNPSSREYLDAFASLDADHILVFPNHPNSILAARNAAELCREADVRVIDCKSMAQCYAVLPMLDFAETNMDTVIASIEDILSHMRFATVTRASKDASFGSREIRKGDYIAMAGKELLAVGNDLVGAAAEAVDTVLRSFSADVITVFCGKTVSAEQMDEDLNGLRARLGMTEIQTVQTAHPSADLLLSFEE